MDRKMINYQLPTRTSAAPSPVGGYESVKDELAKLWPRGNSDYNNVLIIIMKTRQRGRFTPFGQRHWDRAIFKIMEMTQENIFILRGDFLFYPQQRRSVVSRIK